MNFFAGTSSTAKYSMLLDQHRNFEDCDVHFKKLVASEKNHILTRVFQVLNTRSDISDTGVEKAVADIFKHEQAAFMASE